MHMAYNGIFSTLRKLRPSGFLCQVYFLDSLDDTCFVGFEKAFLLRGKRELKRCKLENRHYVPTPFRPW